MVVFEFHIKVNIFTCSKSLTLTLVVFESKNASKPGALLEGLTLTLVVFEFFRRVNPRLIDIGLTLTLVVFESIVKLFLVPF